VDPGETPSEAALREVREEAGVEARLVGDLGDVRYFYVRGGRRIAKRVEFFLLDYVAGQPEDHDHEVEEARWMPLEEAARLLTYQGEREMARRALSRSTADG
jgi:8-oxo-dGTP pyrophosphatase MutT (NUDIX family)